MTDNLSVPIAVGNALLATEDRNAAGVHWQKVEVSGESGPLTNSSLATSTATVSTSVANMGNVTFALFGVHAGFTVVFEASPDGGTTYFPIQVQREFDGVVLATEVLATNAAQLYTADCPGVTHIRVRATARTSGTVTVIIAPGGMLAMPTVSIGNTGGATTSVTSVTAAVANTAIKAANNARRGLTVFNDSTASLYLLLNSGTASTTNFSIKLQPNGYYEVPFGYTGAVQGIWSAANGAARVTELTA